MRDIIENEFTEDGSLERALHIVRQSGGVDRAMELAVQEAEKVGILFVLSLQDVSTVNCIEFVVHMESFAQGGWVLAWLYGACEII